MKVRCRACELQQEIITAMNDSSLRSGERIELVQDLKADQSKAVHVCVRAQMDSVGRIASQTMKDIFGAKK